MEENQAKNQEETLPEVTFDDIKVTDAEVAELEGSSLPVGETLSDIQTEELEKKEVVFRHPQQVLSNREIQILFNKQAKVSELKAKKEELGEDPDTVEDLTLTEKGAISLFLVRAKNQNSKAKISSTKDRKSRKKARKSSKKSRKINR